MLNWFKRKRNTPANQLSGSNTSQRLPFISYIQSPTKPEALPLKTTPPLAQPADTLLSGENQEQRLAIEIAVTIIKDFENFSAFPYCCEAGKLTIGYGRTIGVKEGDRVDRDDEEAWLKHYVIGINRQLDMILKVPINRYQRAALLSFGYNTGMDIDQDDIAEGLGDSTLLKKLNNKDFAGAALEFKKWNKVRKNGKLVVSNGLTNRRKKEAELFNMKG